MGNTIEKLQYIQGTKTAIKDAIDATGITVVEGETFRNYAGKVKDVALKNHTFFERVKLVFGTSPIISFYPINEASGNVLTDVVNGYNGACSEVTLNQRGNYNTRSGLWSAASYAHIYPGAGQLNIDEGTIAMWVKMPKANWTDGNSYVMFRFAGTGATPLIYLFKRNAASGDTIAVYYTRNSTTVTNELSPISTDGWVFFSVSWSKTLNKSEARIDGNLFNVVAQATCEGDVTTLWNQPNYAALGSFYGLSAVGGSSFAGNISNVLLLNRYATENEILEILKYPEVIWEGDSRTKESGHPYMSYGANHFTCRNVGVGGTTVTQMIARATTTVDPFYEDGKIVVLWGGVNESADTAQNLYNKLRDYCLARKAAGFKVIICTEIDARDAVRLSSGWTAKYQELNTLIKADYSFADAVADLGANVNLQDATNTTYFKADAVHLTTAGFLEVASVITPVLAELL